MKKSFIIFSQLNSKCKNDNRSHTQQVNNCDASQLSKKLKQLTLWESPQTPVPSAKLFCNKPQIISIPNISPKQRDRYRVLAGNKILGNRLTLDEALKLAKQGGL